MATRLDEQTNIPLFAALASLPVLIGFIMWLTSIDSKATAAIEQNVSQDNKIEHSTEILMDIRERIIRIETKLEADKK